MQAACSSTDNTDGGTSSGTTSGSAGATTGQNTTTTSSTTATTGSTSGSASTTGSSAGSTTAGTASSTAGTTGSGTTGIGTTGSGTTGIASSGTGGTTGTADGGIDAGCVNVGAYQPEFFGCFLRTVCRCDLACSDDPSLPSPNGVCETPCTTNADCLNPLTACRKGACQINPCVVSVGDGGIDAGLTSTCTAQGINNGTCVLALVGSLSSSRPFCRAPGTATTSCDRAAFLDDAGSICSQGFECFGQICDYVGCHPGNRVAVPATCTALCDPTATGGCDAGESCVALLYPSAAPQPSPKYGFCLPPGDAGCSIGLTGSQFGVCNTSVECDCPQQCVTDPGFPQTVCEVPCSTTADCASTSTTCVSGHCAVNFCFGDVNFNTVPGTLTQPCNVLDAGDGTCIGFDVVNYWNSAWGVCVQGGTATNTCVPAYVSQVFPPSPYPDRSNLAGLCGVGEDCNSHYDGGGSCVPVCDPTVTSNTCGDAGLGCFNRDFTGNGWPIGQCLACLAAGATCSGSGFECCDPKTCVAVTLDGGVTDAGIVIIHTNLCQ
jgi:hypothetical protein